MWHGAACGVKTKSEIDEIAGWRALRLKTFPEGVSVLAAVASNFGIRFGEHCVKYTLIVTTSTKHSDKIHQYLTPNMSFASPSLQPGQKFLSVTHTVSGVDAYQSSG